MAEAAAGTGRRRWAWLLLGASLLLVSNGRWVLPLAGWLFAAGWLVFLERSRLITGLPIAFTLFLSVQLVMWRGIIPVPGLLYLAIVAIYALVYFLPLVVHRLLLGRVAGARFTLVYPLAVVSLEMPFQRWITPYGSWASTAYTQTDFPALLQLTSLTGLAGITFLLAWLGSIGAWIARPEQSALSRIRVAAGYVAVLLAVLTLGHLRLATPRTAAPAVRVAGLVGSPELTLELERLLAPARRGEPLDDDVLGALEEVAGRLNEDLFARTRREARAGARLVAWSETAARTLHHVEPAFLERASRLAAEEAVVLLVAYGVWRPESRPPLENKVVAIDAEGRIAWEYHKAQPIVGAESPFIEAGDGVIRALDTSFGRVGAVICHDLDFPALLRSAGRERIGLMVGPSADWPLIADLHAEMARLRAIEGGFTLLRPTSDGRSIAVDDRGRLLADVADTRDAVVAWVPAVPSRTPYGALGDLFGWLCIAALLGSVALALRRPASAEKPW